MKKYLLCILVALLLITMARAENIQIPNEAVGISEKDFQEIKAGGCYYEQMPETTKTKYGSYCSPIITKFENKIIFIKDHEKKCTG